VSNRPTERALAHPLSRYGWLLPAAALLLTCWIRNVSRPGSQAEGCFERCATASSSNDTQLRVMSLNVLHGFPRFSHLGERLAVIAAEIERLDADIVCLQEVPWVPPRGGAARYLADRTGLNHVYLRANGNRWAILFEEGEAILSRYPLREVTFAELRPRASAFEHRMVLQATARTSWGDVSVFVTHLTNGDPEINQAQAESLMAFINDHAHDLAIIAGDFNATEDSPQIEFVSQRSEDLWRLANEQGEGFTCCVDDLTSRTSGQLEQRIDYLFLLGGPDQRVEVSDCKVVLDQPVQTARGWIWASDHAGLLAALSVPGGQD
jgi:endonuclease/exonuclease/phosphatase family metal-dependent hydrolase